MEIGEIYPAIQKVMAAVPTVEKRTDRGQDYFATEDIITALRPAMIAHGIVMHPAEIEDVREDVLVSDDKRQFKTTIIGKIRFAHVGGSYIEVPSIGSAIDLFDKGATKAYTYLVRNALIRTFLISEGETPGNGNGGPQRRHR